MRRRGQLPDRNDEIGQIIFLIMVLVAGIVVIAAELLK